MKIQRISMEWKPAPIPQTGFLADGIYAQGTLLKDGQPVYFEINGVGGHSLQRAIFNLGAGPEAEDWMPLKSILWQFDDEIDADTLDLAVFDSNYPHTVLVNGKAFPIGVDTWKSYTMKLVEFKLEDWLPQDPRQGPPLPSFLNVFWPWYKG